MSSSEFLRAFEKGTRGLEAFSVGACPGCRECGLDRDSFSLEGARVRYSSGVEHPLRLWDEGSGDVYVYVETLGPVGVVRADTFEEAWECAVDEIMDDADPTDPDSYARSYDPSAEESELAEGVHHRSSGVPSCPGLSSPLAREDTNGARLIHVPIDARDLPETVEVLGWTIELEWAPDRESALAIADEGGFSWSSCEVCGSSLGGDRYPAHYADGEGIGHLEVCADCLVYSANGDEPETWGNDDE